MHTLRCLLLAWVLSIPVFSIAQDYEYQPMVLEGAHWFMYYNDCSTIWYDDYYVYSIKGDSIVNDTTYKKIYREDFVIDDDSRSPVQPLQIENSTLVALLRENISTRKVWVKFISGLVAESYFDNCSDLNEVLNQEQLLYDFSLEASDTIDWCYAQIANLEEGTPFTVDEVGISSGDCFAHSPNRTLFVSGHLESVCGLVPSIDGGITESIGFSCKGIFFNDWGNCNDYCLGTDNECGIFTSVKEVNQRVQVVVTPNPVSDVLEVVLEGQLIPEKISLATYTGEIIKNVKASSKIYVSDVPSGIYTLTILTSDGGIISKRVSILH